MNEINHYQLRNKIYKFMAETVTDAVIIDVTIVDGQIRRDHKSLLVIDVWNQETGASNLLFVSLTGFVQAHILDVRNRRFVLNDIKDLRDYLGGKRNDYK